MILERLNIQGKEPPVITTREELKKDAAREEWKKLIAQGWRRTEEDWTKKIDRDANPQQVVK